MSDLASALRARLATAFGTVLYVDAASGELRHGPHDSSPANAVYVADPASPAPPRRGLLMHDADGASEPIVCFADRCICLSRSQSEGGSASPTMLELIPLERGLIAFKVGDAFLSAIPGGQMRLSAPMCSTWELFLASEAWCTDPADSAAAWREKAAEMKFDARKIAGYIVNPKIRLSANTRPHALKVLIYGYTKWSHGRIYHDLCCHLHRRGYIVDVLNWHVNHRDDMAELMRYYDLFMAPPDGVAVLLDTYGVPYDRIIVVSHAEFDIHTLVGQKGIKVFSKFAGYAVVSDVLYCASQAAGIPRAPMVTPLGVNYSEFYTAVSDRLETVGYASSMSLKINGVEVKRGDLAEAAARDAGLEFKVAGSTKHQIMFQDMPHFYRSVDAVLISSIIESASLPVMEAAAAGRLVIGTPVGHFPLKASQGGGILAPMEADKYKTFTANTLRHYKENPSAYIDTCSAIQEAARNFDWQYTIDDWVDLLGHANGPRSRPVQVRTSAVAPQSGASQTQKRFTHIYRHRGFGGAESRSGPGSSLAKTAKLRAELPEVLESLGIKRLIDAPCGDMNWMRHVAYDFDLFIGVDIVRDLIESLRSQFPSSTYCFQQGDICEQILPTADAILCRDCFVHLPFSAIYDAIRLFKQSRATFLLTTTFPDKDNEELPSEGWRPLNFQAYPFSWPSPVSLIREHSVEDSDPWDENKCIGIWYVATVPDPGLGRATARRCSISTSITSDPRLPRGQTAALLD